MALDPQGILQLLERFGYLIVFLAGLAEAMPLLGFLVPGQAIIILAGAVAATDRLSLLLIILVAIPAGILGDAVGYYLGRYYGRSFLERFGPRIGIREKHLARSDALFQKYGPFALVLMRFSFLTRAIGPILAGMSRMRQLVFWPVNIAGAIAWSVGYALLGYFFGVSFLLLQGLVGRILAFTVLGIIGLYGLYRVLRKYAAQFTRDDFYVALMGVAGLAVFGVVAQRVEALGMRNRLDLLFSAFTLHLQPFAPLFRVVEAISRFEILAVLALGLLVFLAARRLVWEAALVGLGVGGGIVAVEALRSLFANFLPAGPGDSFPSAHAAVPLVFAGVLTYLAAERSDRPRMPVAAAMAGGVFSALAAFSRLAQGHEYPSAVLAGLALGAAWLSLSILLVEFGLKRDAPS